MSYAVMPINEWQDIVDSVRAKTGKSDALVSGQVSSEIDSLKVGNTLNEFLLGTKTDITAEDLAGVTEIRNYLFYGDIITSAYVPDSVTKIGQRAFCTCKNLTNIRMSNNVETIADYAFECCTNLESISLPEGVTSIGMRAFYSCGNITSITIPDSVTMLGTFLCGECSNLVTATVGNNVKLTGQGIFQKCSKLNSVTLGNSVSFVSADSFDGCASLAEITLPSSVKTISTRAFQNCTSLMKVVCLAETPPTLNATALDGVPADCIFEVKPASVEAYKAETNWSVRADNIVALTDEEVAQYGG